MKTLFKLIVLFLLVSNMAVAQQTTTDFSKLKGPYLGQTPPGLTPVLFAPGIVSTGMAEACATFTSDGKECFFMIMVNGHETIVTTKISNGIWTAPEVASFSGQFNDGFPTILPDGSKLFFHSNKPIENGAEYNIWFVEKTGKGWGEPKPIGSPINGKLSALCPFVSATGNLYFTRRIAKGEEFIYCSVYSNGNFKEPERLPKQVNTHKMQYHAAISPDESCLVLPLQGREDAIGKGENYYVSFKDSNGTWSELINLGKEINSLRVWGIPSFSNDGKYFFFSAQPFYKDVNVEVYDRVMSYHDLQEMAIKNPVYDRADIYWVSAKVIEELKPKE
jgi:hypothetical protein